MGLQQPTAPTNTPPKPPNETTQQHAITDSPILQKLSTDTPKSNSSKKSQENQFPKPPTNIQNNQIEKTLTNTTDTDVLHEDEPTSRNNPKNYYEAKKIVDEYMRIYPKNHYEAKKILEEYYPSNQDRDKYEEEPKKSAVKRKNSPTSPNRKETPKSTMAKKTFEEYDPSNQDRNKYEEEPKKSSA